MPAQDCPWHAGLQAQRSSVGCQFDPGTDHVVFGRLLCSADAAENGAEAAPLQSPSCPLGASPGELGRRYSCRRAAPAAALRLPPRHACRRATPAAAPRLPPRYA